MKNFFFWSIVCVCCAVQSPAQASADLASLEAQISQLNETVGRLTLMVESQQREIASLKAEKATLPSVQAPAALPSTQIQSRSAMKIIPEIGAVADVALRADTPRSDNGGADRVSVREVELVLGGSVDPYSRLDSMIAFTEEDTAELEEAYLTCFGLPWDMTARIGRFKPRIGKVLAVHRDSLDTVDEPLVIQRYFGEEGMSKSGADLTKLLDIPSSFVHQATFGVLEGGNGEGGTAFGDTKRRPTIYGHLKNYLDISDSTNLEIGFSDAIGSRDADSTFEVNLLGVDGTLIHHLNPMQDIKLQCEVFNLNRTESELITFDDTTGETRLDDFDGNVWGGYALFDFRFHPQWAAGFRYDQVEIVDRPFDSLDHFDTGYSGYLTFYQSEFARWRVQFTHLDLTNGTDDNQVWVQGTFAVGEHKHKIQ